VDFAFAVGRLGICGALLSDLVVPFREDGVQSATAPQGWL
jgi:hypothetical protein